MRKLRMDEKQMQQNAKGLQKVAEKQYQNQQALAKQERTEQDVFELNRESRQLFGHLLHTWHKDREFGNWLEQVEMETQYHKQQMAEELRSQKEELLQERRQLSELENDLYYQRQSLAGEEKGEEK